MRRITYDLFTWICSWVFSQEHIATRGRISLPYLGLGVAICILGSQVALGEAQMTGDEQGAVADFQRREALLRTKGFVLRLKMYQANPGFESEADVDYTQIGSDFKATFVYSKTTEFPPENVIKAKREFSLDKEKYSEMDYFTGQGVVSDPKRYDERIVKNIILPSQFWLDYRSGALSVLIASSNPAWNDFDNSFHFAFEYGSMVLFVEPKWNNLVKKAHVFERRGIKMREFVVTKAKELAEGIFLPEDFSYETFGPGADNKPVLINRFRWHLQDVKLNDAFPSELTLSFPRGGIIADNLKKTAYQVGNPGKGVDRSAVKQLGEKEGSSVWVPNRIAWVCLLVIVITILLGFWLKRTTKAQGPSGPNAPGN